MVAKSSDRKAAIYSVRVQTPPANTRLVAEEKVGGRVCGCVRVLGGVWGSAATHSNRGTADAMHTAAPYSHTQTPQAALKSLMGACCDVPKAAAMGGANLHICAAA